VIILVISENCFIKNHHKVRGSKILNVNFFDYFCIF